MLPPHSTALPRDRRAFLAGLPLLFLRPRAARAAAPSVLSVAGKDEPGARVRIAGTIFQEDGETPAAGARLFVYQTDAAGWYSKPANNPRKARLHGTVTTDVLGRYEITTVEPGRYADMSSPPSKHIHVHLEAEGLPDHWIESYLFSSDLSVTDSERRTSEKRGAFGHVLGLTRGETGIWEATRNIRIDRTLAERNRIRAD